MAADHFIWRDLRLDQTFNQLCINSHECANTDSWVPLFLQAMQQLSDSDGQFSDSVSSCWTENRWRRAVPTSYSSDWCTLATIINAKHENSVFDTFFTQFCTVWWQTAEHLKLFLLIINSKEHHASHVSLIHCCAVHWVCIGWNVCI